MSALTEAAASIELPANFEETWVDDHIATFREKGWVKLGVQAPALLLQALRDRTDAIMMGEVRYDGLFFQRDADSGSYDDLTYGRGFEGPTKRYRKLEKLELDPIFLSWIRAPIFRAITKRLIGGDVTLYRATVFNKAADTGGSEIPWHQDGGDFWGLDREPTLQAWTAIDDAPEGGGCLEIFEGSHLRGLVSPLGGVVAKNFLDDAHPDEHAVRVPAKAGEVVLIHNHVWHRSQRSRSGLPRRAFTVCYMDAETRCRRRKRAPRSFFRVF